ncbi:MAG: metal ABC transporter permease [Ruminococcus sp.]|nr:metal ABC transporter permease [Ruminococcus sp.]MBQ8124206.1 metal ABC transporter permease [Ruminococcus sp.]HBB19237.1 ABC transporter [Ruminococcus sp.]HOO05573.1 metal ABC transporter permease [Ruminococcus sp.]HOR21766.1 metal ABC transporter permease [Ruminococcus sp.]
MEEIRIMFSPEFFRSILLPALIGGLAVTVCASLLGVTLVLKKYSMIGDGLSHIGYGALSVAAVMNLAPLKVALPVVVIAAFILLRLSENSKLSGDSGIALFSTTALSVGILVSSKAGLTNDVSHYMFGSILAMSRSDVILSIVLSLAVIAAFIFLYDRIFSVTFDESFAQATGVRVKLYSMIFAVLTAVTVVLGMMMMGSLLISSLIVIPTLTAMRVCRSFKGVVLVSGTVSAVSFLIGMFSALLLNTAPGASVVIVNVIFFLAFSLAGKLRK